MQAPGKLFSISQFNKESLKRLLTIKFRSPIILLVCSSQLKTLFPAIKSNCQQFPSWVVWSCQWYLLSMFPRTSTIIIASIMARRTTTILATICLQSQRHYTQQCTPPQVATIFPPHLFTRGWMAACLRNIPSTLFKVDFIVAINIGVNCGQEDKRGFRCEKTNREDTGGQFIYGWDTLCRAQVLKGPFPVALPPSTRVVMERSRRPKEKITMLNGDKFMMWFCRYKFISWFDYTLLYYSFIRGRLFMATITAIQNRRAERTVVAAAVLPMELKPPPASMEYNG